MPRSTVELSGHIIDALILPKVLDIMIKPGDRPRARPGAME